MSRVAASNRRTVIQGCHLNFRIARRLDEKGDSPVIKAAAYNACGRLTDSFKNRTYNFTRKRDESLGHFVLVPDRFEGQEWLKDPERFWNAACDAEKRADAQVGRQIQFSIPREVHPDDYAEYCAAVLESYRAAGMVAHINIHDVEAADGGRNPHAHVILSMRELDPSGSGFRATKSGAATAWNKQFRDQKGRTERLRIESAANRWLADNGYDVQVRMQHSDTYEGHDNDTPPPLPEPVLSKPEIEIAKRARDSPSVSVPGRVVVLSEYRNRRSQIREIDREIAQLKAEAEDMAKVKWRDRSGGYDALPAELKKTAQREHKVWRAKTAERCVRKGEDTGWIWDLYEYVDNVQVARAHDARRQSRRRNPVPGQPPASRPGDEQVNGISWAPTSTAAPASPDLVDEPEEEEGDDGLTPRIRELLERMQAHYRTDGLSADAVKNVRNIRLNTEEGTAAVLLNDGSRFVDHGDRITTGLEVTDALIDEISEAAARHGWTSVNLTGTDDFKRRVAIALSSREPPVAHDFALSAADIKAAEAIREARKQAAAALAARQNAVASPGPHPGAEAAKGELEQYKYAVFTTAHGDRFDLDGIVDRFDSVSPEMLERDFAHEFQTPEQFAARRADEQALADRAAGDEAEGEAWAERLASGQDEHRHIQATEGPDAAAQFKRAYIDKEQKDVEIAEVSVSVPVRPDAPAGRAAGRTTPDGRGLRMVRGGVVNRRDLTREYRDFVEAVARPTGPVAGIPLDALTDRQSLFGRDLAIRIVTDADRVSAAIGNRAPLYDPIRNAAQTHGFAYAVEHFADRAGGIDTSDRWLSNAARAELQRKADLCREAIVPAVDSVDDIKSRLMTAAIAEGKVLAQALKDAKKREADTKPGFLAGKAAKAAHAQANEARQQAEKDLTAYKENLVARTRKYAAMATSMHESSLAAWKGRNAGVTEQAEGLLDNIQRYRDLAASGSFDVLWTTRFEGLDAAIDDKFLTMAGARAEDDEEARAAGYDFNEHLTAARMNVPMPELERVPVRKVDEEHEDAPEPPVAKEEEDELEWEGPSF